jgi:DNA invertase Pin-like site-specific DNA recombinase
MKRVALYMRCSTHEQDVTNQQRELEVVAQRHGWEVVGIFSDQGVSGARDRRPEFDRLRRGIMRKEMDVVAAWSVDRLGRSLQNLLAFLGELQAKGVHLYLHQQGLDTQTAAGRALFQMLGVFAEWERFMIRDRIMAGLSRAKSQGRKLGPAFTNIDIERARALLSEGRSIRSVAKEIHASPETLRRRLSTADRALVGAASSGTR